MQSTHSLLMTKQEAFCGQCRSRSDCTEHAVWSLIYTVVILILYYNWNVSLSWNGSLFLANEKHWFYSVLKEITAYVHTINQDQTVQNEQSNLGSILSAPLRNILIQAASKVQYQHFWYRRDCHSFSSERRQLFRGPLLKEGLFQVSKIKIRLYRKSSLILILCIHLVSQAYKIKISVFQWIAFSCTDKGLGLVLKMLTKLVMIPFPGIKTWFKRWLFTFVRSYWSL